MYSVFDHDIIILLHNVDAGFEPCPIGIVAEDPTETQACVNFNRALLAISNRTFPPLTNLPQIVILTSDSSCTKKSRRTAIGTVNPDLRRRFTQTSGCSIPRIITWRLFGASKKTRQSTLRQTSSVVVIILKFETVTVAINIEITQGYFYIPNYNMTTFAGARFRCSRPRKSQAMEAEKIRSTLNETRNFHFFWTESQIPWFLSFMGTWFRPHRDPTYHFGSHSVRIADVMYLRRPSLKCTQ